MADPSEGVPFQIQNMHEGKRYIKKGKTLFPCASFENNPDLPPGQEPITVLSKQMGRIVLERDFSYVTKSGFGVRPPEAEAMRLVSTHTSIPSPEVIYSHFRPNHGTIDRMDRTAPQKWDLSGINAARRVLF